VRGQARRNLVCGTGMVKYVCSAPAKETKKAVRTARHTTQPRLLLQRTKTILLDAQLFQRSVRSIISSPLVPRPSHSSAARIFTCPPFTSESRAPSAHTEAGRLASALALAQPLNISASRHLRLTNTRHNLLHTTAAPRVVIQLPKCQSPSATRRGTL
jgi:hypothetical protein